MFKSKTSNKRFSVGLALLLAFSMVVPAYGESAKSPDKLSWKSTSVQTAETKVAQKLSLEFENSDYVTYLVKMKEQSDTTAVSKQALQKAAMQKETPSAAKLSARSAVVSTLRETASRSQYSLQSFLQDQQELGKVKSYKSYYIVNSLAVTSTKEVMEAVAGYAEVEKILPDETRYLQKAEVSGKSETGAEAKTETNADADAGKSAAPAKQPPASNEISTDVQTDEDVKTGQAGSGAAPSSVEWNIAHINAPEVWAKGIDGTGIVVASLDTGVDYTHPALHRKWRGLDAAGNIVNPELSWYDAYSGQALPSDNDGHGTHTMGTMVGSEADGSNQIGVAPGAKWIAVRIFNPSTTDSIILDGAQWLLAPVDAQGNLHPELAPDVVNNSWGGGPGLDEWFRPLVQAWRDAQIFPEFSAGNITLTNPGGPGSVANPANYPEAFATGATDINDNLADFSLRGPSPYGEIKPEVSAPGVNIRSSVPGGYEGGWNGTSMAGPHTTALAALLLQANHSLTVDQLEDIITRTATPETSAEYPESPNNGYGYGVINALDAVGSVIEGIGTVSGKVVTGGDDLEPPVLDYTPPQEVFAGVDVPLIIHATDNVSVTSVEVFARTKGSPNYVYLPAKQVSGTIKDGIYSASIPAYVVGNEGLEFYIRVNDYGNNGFDSKVFDVKVSKGVKPGYVQDFENDFAGFTTGGTGGTWQWGVPQSGPGSAASGTKVIATNLSGTYAPNANSYLLAPPIDLTDSSEGALVSYKQWYGLEEGYDEGTVYAAAASTDGEFVPLASFTGHSGGWKTQYLDLKPYKGEQVYLLFNLASDNSGQYEGWYIDDFKVVNPDADAPGAPGGLTASTDGLGNVQLEWTSPEDEDVKQFNIYRSQGDNSHYEQVGTSTVSSYQDSLASADGTYYYAVEAEDYSGNVSVKSNEVSLNVVSPELIFGDSFDGVDDNGWTHGGTLDKWQRGIPQAPGPENAVSPPNVWGTNLGGNYDSNADFSLVSPVIDLTDVPHAALTFSHWFELETNYDFGTVEITQNGGATWRELLKYSSSTAGKQWTPVVFNLDGYTGSPVQFRFRVKTDGSVVKTGWYVDDFRVLVVHADQSTAGGTAKAKAGAVKNAAAGPLFKMTSTTKADLAVQNHDSASVSAGSAWSQGASSFGAASGASASAGAVSSGAASSGLASAGATLGGDAASSDAASQGASSDAVSTGAAGGSGIGLQSLPASATVTVVETGRSVQTDPATGKYSFSHVAGSYTLKAEAYGYYPQTKPVTIRDNETANVSFSLEPIPHGEIQGTVTDERSGEPIADADVLVLEDASVAAVRTDADGRFTLDVLAGTYSLLVQARDYYSKTVSVTVPGNGTAEALVEMKPFIGLPGEIAYDDGTAENARAFNAANNAWAVRFTPESGLAEVTGASLRFWNNEFPTPGGTDFQYAVYDAGGSGGAPGRLLAGPFDATALRNDEWTHVELAEPVTVEGDFYIVYIQPKVGTLSPGLATDESGPNAERSWQRVSGVWTPSPLIEGNYMIRATVKTGIGAPVLTSPAADTYTRDAELSVTGTSPAEGSEIKVFIDGAEAGTGVVVNKTFSVPVTLHDGRNELTAEALVDGKTTDLSAPTVITLDQTPPELVVASPQDGELSNGEVVHVEGTVTDEYFAGLNVNGVPVEPAADGSFATRVLVNEGDNTITVTATDLAGNETTVTRLVTVNTALPEIGNIAPAEDVHIASGDSVTVSFDSAPGLTASFTIELPLAPNGLNRGGIAMTETAPGHYEGTYQTPASLTLEGGVIVISARDAAGNEIEAEAPGKLYVGGGSGNPNPPGGDPQQLVTIDAPASGARKEKIEFHAVLSDDYDGKNTKYEWDFGDGNTATKAAASHKYSHAGTYTVTLTVKDKQGVVGTAVHNIVIE